MGAVETLDFVELELLVPGCRPQALGRHAVVERFSDGLPKMVSIATSGGKRRPARLDRNGNEIYPTGSFRVRISK